MVVDRGSAAAQEDEGWVCGIARISLLDLVRGRTHMRFAAPLAPYTTIRGAASLDWGRRPGTYAATNALVKGWVRCAVPLTAMVSEHAAAARPTAQACPDPVLTTSQRQVQFNDGTAFGRITRWACRWRTRSFAAPSSPWTTGTATSSTCSRTP